MADFEFVPSSKPFTLYVARAHEAAGRPTTLDPEGLNDERIGYAIDVVAEFQRLTRTDHEDAIKDLLCDLRHLCAYVGQDFDALVGISQRNFDAETAGAGL